MPDFDIRAIDHVVLRCRNVASMKAFYCDVLGFSVAKENRPLGLTHLRGGNAMIDLVAVDGELGRAGGGVPAHEARNMDHLCLRIAPFEVERLRGYFAARGIDIGDPRTRFGGQGDGLSFYLSDPEGNRVELKGDAERH